MDVETIADLIFSLTQQELRQLRQILNDEWGDGGAAGVGAIIPPEPPLQTDAAEAELPEDYWESAQ